MSNAEADGSFHRVPAFICEHVFEHSRPALLVVRLGWGWQLLCGDSHQGGPRLVGLSHLVSMDPTLTEILDLPEGFEAEREAPGKPWTRRPAPEEEPAE